MVERHCVNYIMFRTYIEPDGPFVLYSDYEQLERDRDFWKEQFQVETRYRIELADKGTLQALTDANSRMEKAEAERDRLAKANAELLASLASVLQACDEGRMVERGAGGMTIDAQIRRSVINGVPAWPIEEARALLDKHKATSKEREGE